MNDIDDFSLEPLEPDTLYPGDETTEPREDRSWLDPYQRKEFEEREQQRLSNATLEGEAWFEATFESLRIPAVEPLDATVNYGIEVYDSDPWTTEATVFKYWRGTNDHLRSESVTVAAFPSEDPESEAAAQQVVDALQASYDENGLQAMMHQAEQMALDNGHRSPRWADQPLFRDGPPDRFMSLGQAVWHDSLDDAHAEPLPASPEVAALDGHYQRVDVREAVNPDGEPLGYAVVASVYPQLPSDFDDREMDDTLYPSEAWGLELAHFKQQPQADAYAEQQRETPLSELADTAIGEWRAWDMHDINHFMAGNPQVIDAADWQPVPTHETPDWHLAALPAHTPDGEPLGYALHTVVLPPTGADAGQMLEMAHFATPEAADRFEREFNSYLIPGVLEGPDLAVEVARLEGLSTEWKPLEGDDLHAYRDGTLSVTHTADDWQPYNPHAEREARLATEGDSLSTFDMPDASPDRDWEF